MRTRTTVRELLLEKSGEIYSIPPDALIYEALEMLAARDIGALVVVEDGQVRGIFSERDYARKVILKGKSSKNSPVRSMMTRDVLFVSPNESIEDCMQLMTTKRVRHLPVMEKDRLVGIITIGDVVKQVISDQEFRINELEKYISGGNF